MKKALKERKTISLSKHLGVSRKRLEKMGVYDTTLGIDTKLFIDPKLLVKAKIPEFKHSRKVILQYFAKLLKVHRQSHKSGALFQIALDMLAIPEPQGLAIGYGSKTDRGTAISETVAKEILLSATEILSVGIDDEELVEILGLFVKGFGPDSMSDLTVSIVYKDFCKYTERIARELKVKTRVFNIKGEKYRLPKHPFKDKAIIFVPHKLLRPLPIAVSWSEIAAAAEQSKKLRDSFNDIVRPAIEASIRDVATKTPAEVKDFKENLEKLLDLYRRVSAKPYSLRADTLGYHGIQPFADKEASTIKPTFVPKTPDELIVSVRELIQQFQRSVEDNGGNKILYRRTATGKIKKDSPHNEDVAQILFFIVADLFCQQADIMLSRESNAGLGPVDFSLGTGYKNKVVVEIKKSTNHDLESGYLKQVAAYEKSEAAHHSFFVVIVVKVGKKGGDDYATQLKDVKRRYEENIKNSVPTPELIIIDGLIHLSPSKRKK